MIWYGLLVAAVAAERVAELVVARRNERWSTARGATETGQGHYPAMVALHTGLLIACPAEVWLADSPFVPALAWPMLTMLTGAQALRWWCIHTLGPRWNTRVIVVPGMALVTGGPYRWRWLRHPNYVAVVAEGVALPMVHTAWITATVFTVLNAALLAVRIRCENRALTTAATPTTTASA
ncbi:isoprenylcysteine carboxyl methyltransferase family protein [Streptomyces sp. NBC_01451]|uniref:isoprenylcysteine carboxyl methyltransferase family protein n=1 Tax=Streptomyces sp. NBC_01451 TaxID=2903872 RepID=UPI002E35BDA4|nr:isoprenylcysteine carboxylmethyltransferase family protein [Streptomyces sp. NBC_01451]